MNTTKEVTITTTQKIDRKGIEFFLKNGLTSIKRSGAGISLTCAPATDDEAKNLQSVKDELKRQEK